MQNTIKDGSDLSEIIIQPEGGGFIQSLVDLWKYQELLYFLAWRDIKVRYKQTALGADKPTARMRDTPNLFKSSSRCTL